MHFWRVCVNVINDAFDQCVFQALFDGLFSPSCIGNRRFAFCFYVFREIDQAFGCIVTPVQQHVLNALSQVGLDFFVNRELSRIHDSHVQAGANGVKEKGGVHRFPDGVVSAKRK